MYDQQIQEDLFYIMLYAAVAMMSLMASCYLLLRRANAIAPDVTSSVRLRRWTAALFVSMTLSHIWYMPILFFTSGEDIMLSYLVGAMLDYMTLVPLVIVVLLTMLQDRRRPLWPVSLIVTPPIVGLAIGAASRSITRLPLLYTYQLLLGIGLIIYMVRATRQYGRWLRDNYADLEHKEVWQSFVVLAIIMLVFGIYMFGIKGMTYHYAVQVNDIVLICYLLWRVEALSDLTLHTVSEEDTPLSSSEGVTIAVEVPSGAECGASSLTERKVSGAIGSLLNRYCEIPQLYLQNDLTLLQLAKAIGTNRLYLSQYFSSRGMNYNAYINDLRINHFINLYREAVATQEAVTAQELAQQSGYRSYRTFGDAFKRKMGLSVTAWVKSAQHEGQGKS